MEFTNRYYDGADFTVTPSDDEFPYYCTIRPAFQYDELSDQELLEKVVAEDGFMIDFYATTGVYEYENENVWLTDTGYLVLVFGWADGAATTNIHRFPFRTLEPNIPPSECRFDVEVTGLTSRSATVAITPSDETSVYMWDLIADADYQQFKGNMKQYVTDYVAADIESLDYNRERGVGGNIFSKMLEPGTTYYVWAACIDEFGKPAADVVVSAPFETLPNQVSDAGVSAVIGKYFNGDDLYALDSEKYASGRGMAYVEVTFSANDEAVVWYGTMVKEDPSDPTGAISDAEIAETLGGVRYLVPDGQTLLVRMGCGVHRARRGHWQRRQQRARTAAQQNFHEGGGFARFRIRGTRIRGGSVYLQRSVRALRCFGESLPGTRAEIVFSCVRAVPGTGWVKRGAVSAGRPCFVCRGAPGRFGYLRALWYICAAGVPDAPGTAAGIEKDFRIYSENGGTGPSVRCRLLGGRMYEVRPRTRGALLVSDASGGGARRGLHRLRG